MFSIWKHSLDRLLHELVQSDDILPLEIWLIAFNDIILNADRELKIDRQLKKQIIFYYNRQLIDPYTVQLPSQRGQWNSAYTGLDTKNTYETHSILESFFWSQLALQACLQPKQYTFRWCLLQNKKPRLLLAALCSCYGMMQVGCRQLNNIDARTSDTKNN